MSSIHNKLIGIFSEFIDQDNSLRKLVIQEDSLYSQVYGFDMTPCCMPFSCTAWHNYQTPGVFIRCHMPCPPELNDLLSLMTSLNEINCELPTGSFVLASDEKDVVFKNGYYYSGSLESEAVKILLNSSKEFLIYHWETVFKKINNMQYVHKHK